MGKTWTMKGVLIAVAEVKVPLKRLPEEDIVKVIKEVYGAATEYENEHSDLELRKKAVGVIDSFYSMQEVYLEENNQACVLRREKETILQFRTMDVVTVRLVDSSETRIVFITRSENFGRAAVVMEMLSSVEAAKVVDKFREIDYKYEHRNNDDETLLSKLKSIKISGGSQKQMSRTSSTSNARFKSLSNASDTSCPSPLVDENRTSATFYYDSSDDASWDGTDDIGETASYRPETPPVAKPSIQDMIEAEINYILETEDRYCKMLQSLEEDRAYLSQRSPNYFRKWLSQLFRQIRPLIAMHEILLASLASAKYDIVKFSEAFMNLKKNFTTYIYYIENIPTVDKIIAEYSSYLKEEKPDLVDKLRQPRMRLNHYVLMLESLVKKVKEAEKCHLQEVITFCKEYLTRADMALLLGTINGCPFSLTECGNYIYRSDVKLTYAVDLQKKIYHLVLFERKLIFVTGHITDFKYVHVIPVDDIFLKENARGLYFSINVHRSDKNFTRVYHFKVKNIKIQQAWISSIRKAIEKRVTSLMRTEGRASFGRSGRKLRLSFAASKGYSPNKKAAANFCEDDTESNDEQESPFYWNNRRKAVRKYSSFQSKTARNTSRENSHAVSDTEDHYSTLRHGMTPLTVWTFYQELEDLYRMLRHEKAKLTERIDTVDVLEAYENQYINKLNEQLGELLKESVKKPPREISRSVRRIFSFHESTFLPFITESDDSKLGFVEALVNFGENVAVLYSEYLSDRCALHEQMFEMDLHNPYVLPIQHFIDYCKFVIYLRQEGEVDAELVNTAALVLHDTITAANNCLLAESVNDVPFALSQCQPILLANRLRMRIDTKMRQDYQVILLKDQIIGLEIHPPRYSYSFALQLDSICLGPSPDDYTFQLDYRSTANARRVFSFRAACKEVKDRWVTEITHILSEQAIKLKQERSIRLEEAPKLELDCLPCPDLHVVDTSKSPLFNKKLNQKPLETDL